MPNIVKVRCERFTEQKTTLWFFALHDVTFGDEKYHGIFGNLVMENLEIWDFMS